MRHLVPLLLLALLVGGCKNEAPTESETGPPDFILNDLDGNAFRFASTEGKVVLLTFFAPWCPHCQEEAPVLAELHETYHDEGLEIVAVATQAESMEQIRQFKEGLEVPYRILVDDGIVSSPRGYNVRTVPTTYVFSRDVTVYGPYGHQSKEAWQEILEPLL